MRTFLIFRLLNKTDRRLGWELILDHDGLTILAKLSTLELPWRDNANGHGDFTKASCIPSGRYRVTFEYSALDAHPNGFLMRIHDVPSRDGIMQHRCVRPADILGCIGEGTGFAKNGDLTGTQEAQDKLEALFKNEKEAQLIIVDVS